MPSKKPAKPDLSVLSADMRAALDAHYSLIDRIAWFEETDQYHDIPAHEQPIYKNLVLIGILTCDRGRYNVTPVIKTIIEDYAPQL